MKKLAMVFVLGLVASACHRGGAPTTQSSPGDNEGSATPRLALDRFMAAARTQDLDALGRAWGSAGGPVIQTMDRKEREQREVIMMRCLKHDTFQVVSETPTVNGGRAIMAELRYKDVTASANFTMGQGPGTKWYVFGLKMEDLQRICVAL